VISIRMN